MILILLKSYLEIFFKEKIIKQHRYTRKGKEWYIVLLLKKKKLILYYIIVLQHHGSYSKIQLEYFIFIN